MTDIYLYSHIPTLWERTRYALAWARFIGGNWCYVALYAAQVVKFK